MQILCRTRKEAIVHSWSDDVGKSWGPLSATNLPNPNLGMDSVTLKDGRHLVIYNHTVRVKRVRGSLEKLNLALFDDGRSWKAIMTLVDSDGGFFYPAIVQTTDGKDNVTHTWKRESIRRVVLDADKIR